MSVLRRSRWLRVSLRWLLLLAAVSGCTGRSSEPLSRPKSTVRSLSDRPPSSSDNMLVDSADTQSPAPGPAMQAGIGVALRIEDGKVFVSHVLPNTPAEQSNSLKPNDQIVAVAQGNESPTDVTGTKKVARVVGMIRGPIGTVVRLTIVPEGKDEEDQIVVSLVRGKIKEIGKFIDGRLLPIGTKAPEFSFAQLGNDEQADLSQFSGRIVVVEFWASWCGPCIKALDKLESLQAEHPEWKGQVELLGVSVDEKMEDAVAVLNRTHWSNISMVWTGPDVLRQYRISGLPTIFVLDRDGNVAAVDNSLDVSAVVQSLLERSNQ